MNKNNYNTRTLHLSAYLRAKGLRLKNIQQNNGQVEFIFADNSKIPELIESLRVHSSRLCLVK